MRATLTYTTARIVLFAVALFLLRLAGAHGLLLIGLALLASGIASYVVLSRWREAMAGSVSGWLHSLRTRLDQGARAEDDR